MSQSDEHREIMRRLFGFLIAVVLLFTVAYCVGLGFHVYWHSQPTTVQEQCPDGTWSQWPGDVPMQRFLAACVGHDGPNPNNGH